MWQPGSITSYDYRVLIFLDDALKFVLRPLRSVGKFNTNIIIVHDCMVESLSVDRTHQWYLRQGGTCSELAVFELILKELKMPDMTKSCYIERRFQGLSW